MKNTTSEIFRILFWSHPQAVAKISGSKDYPNIFGNVWFYSTSFGTIVVASVANLPTTSKGFFGFHIHENGECDGDFSSAGGHFNGDSHPMHIGDLPPLISANGNAFCAFLDDRFSVKDVIDKAVIIHLDADDFDSQPAGNSGKRIACGVVTKF